MCRGRAGVLFPNQTAVHLERLRDLDSCKGIQVGGFLDTHMTRAHRMGLYGNIAIEKAICPDCGGTSFVREHATVCCGASIIDLPKSYKRESLCPQFRRPPTKAEKDAILRRQEWRCLYCGILLETVGHRKGSPVILKTNFDHRIPYAYAQNNTTTNFVAACHVCNIIKKDLVFQDVAEAQVYLENERKKRGYDW